jgi:hypothetical protein
MTSARPRQLSKGSSHCRLLTGFSTKAGGCSTINSMISRAPPAGRMLADSCSCSVRFSKCVLWQARANQQDTRCQQQPAARPAAAPNPTVASKVLEMYILPVLGSGADADNGMAHLVTFIHSVASKVANNGSSLHSRLLAAAAHW